MKSLSRRGAGMPRDIAAKGVDIEPQVKLQVSTSASLLVPHAEEGTLGNGSVLTSEDAQTSSGERVWIDLDNSPHVPFFIPIIEELRNRGVDVVLTARDMYQTRDLVNFFQLKCKVIGGHYGRTKAVKVFCNCSRALQLLPTAFRCHPTLAISHGSRAQILIGKLLGIPTVMLHDYEYSTKTGWLEPDWIMMPDIIPTDRMSKETSRVLTYPGLKEDVYVPRFRADSSILRTLGIRPENIVVTLRPPASDSHYHTQETEDLFRATLRFLSAISGIQVITLPRNERQRHRLMNVCAELISSGRMIIPDGPVDGLSVMWFSDLVISGGGTMNREAAALGVPVYSIFRGKIGAVDEFLAKEGRLTLIGSISELPAKVVVTRWNRPQKPQVLGRPALAAIVEEVLTLLRTKQPARLFAGSKNPVNARGGSLYST